MQLGFKATLLDCDAALDLTPGAHKGLFRRAQALRGLGRSDEAWEAASAAMRCAPPAARATVARLVTELAALTCGKCMAEPD